MVKNSRGGQTLNSSAENQQNSKLRKLKKKKLGSIIIEVAFTLPIVVYLIFFCIELIKINITQEALQSICEEATYLTISHDWEDGPDWQAKINAIIEKYRPSFIPKEAPGYNTSSRPVIRLCVDPWSSLDSMLSEEPYGGSSIFYPFYEGSQMSRAHAGTWIPASHTQFIPSGGKQCFAKNQANYGYYVRDRNHNNEGIEGWPDNTVFVLTVTCNYPFSSGMVKMLFGGGVNTKVTTKACGSVSCNQAPVSDSNCLKGNMYILWARGAGIVNPK